MQPERMNYKNNIKKVEEMDRTNVHPRNLWYISWKYVY